MINETINEMIISYFKSTQKFLKIPVKPSDEKIRMPLQATKGRRNDRVQPIQISGEGVEGDKNCSSLRFITPADVARVVYVTQYERIYHRERS